MGKGIVSGVVKFKSTSLLLVLCCSGHLHGEGEREGGNKSKKLEVTPF